MSGLLRRVAAAVGGYLVDQQKLTDERALADYKADILYQRELALKQIDAQLDDRKSARDHAEQMAQIDETGRVNAANYILQGRVKEATDAASDKRDLDKAITLKKIDFSSSAALEGIKHKYNVSEIQAKSAADLQNSLTEAGVTVDHWQVSPKGELAAYSKDGHLLTQTGLNVAVPPKSGQSSDDDFGALLNGDGGGSSEARTAAPAQAAPKAPAASTPTTGHQAGDTIRNPQTGQVLQLGEDGKWHPYVGIAP